jgi:Immunoglobulin I-set domain
MHDVIVDIGGTAVFTCRVCGKPRPNVTWSGPSRTPIGNTNRTWCEYSDDGTAQLQVGRLIGVNARIWLKVVYLQAVLNLRFMITPLNRFLLVSNTWHN